MGKLRLLACQIEVPDAVRAIDRDAHVANVIKRIGRELKARQADMVVLPELSTIPYSRAAFEQLDQLAETLDGSSCGAFGELASDHGVTVVFGMPRRADDGFRISQVAIGPDGKVIGHFDKLHAAQFGLSMEKEFFSPGSHLMVFECGDLRVAPFICYDIRFPELARTLVVDHDVQLILHCGAYGRDPSFDSWHAFVTARAMENQVCVLSLNRAGELFGDSVFCPPWVDADHPLTHFPAHDEAFVHLEVDLAEIAKVREDYTFLEDRFEDYRALNVQLSTGTGSDQQA